VEKALLNRKISELAIMGRHLAKALQPIEHKHIVRKDVVAGTECMIEVMHENATLCANALCLIVELTAALEDGEDARV